MKAKVNLSIDEQLLKRAKLHAAKESISLSELFGKYLEKVTRSRKQKSIIDIVENMKNPNISPERDLKKEYYKDIEKKYGS